MRFTSTFISLALSTLFVGSISATPIQMRPETRAAATADYAISRIKIVNNGSQNSVRFLQGPVQPGHESEPVPTFNWRQLASLDAGQSQNLPLGPGLSRFAINGQIPDVGDPDYPLFQIDTASSCTAIFLA
ncbi:hypothetical protein AAF712_010800, partial [Marasmius tenuissimus]